MTVWFAQKWFLTLFHVEENHATIQKRPSKEKVTTLSEHVWKLKDQKITWSIKAKAHAFSRGSRRCDLCITEKLIILLADQRHSLNQRTELLSKCPHKRPLCLQAYCENSVVT